MKNETKGMLIGFIGIFIFSLTLPVTKITVETLNPYFLCFARALLAGILAGGYLIYTKAPIPDAKQIRQFAIVALGVVFIFPLFINIAMTTVKPLMLALFWGSCHWLRSLQECCSFKSDPLWAFGLAL